MKNSTLLLGLLLLSFSGFSQQINYIGFNSGIHSDIYRLSSSETGEYNSRVEAFPSFSGGIITRISLYENLSFETGLNYKVYNSYQPFDAAFGISLERAPGLKAFFLPVNLLAQLPFDHNRKSVHIMMGTKIGYNRSYGSEYIEDRGERIFSDIHMFAVANIGFGFDAKFLNDCLWHCSFQRAFGYKTLSTTTTFYEDESGEDHQYVTTNEGDNWSLNFGVRLPIKNYQDQKPNPYKK